MLNLIRNLFWLALWLFGLAMLLWYPMRWWPGDRLRAVQLLNYFMPWLLIILTPALLAAATARRLRLTMTLAIPTLLIALNFIPLFLPRINVALAGNAPLKVMSYNLLYRNEHITEAAALIHQENPDILLLQEVALNSLEILPTLKNFYPDEKAYYAYDPSIAQAVISRYPIISTDISQDYRTQKLLIDTPDGPIHVWNVHPNTPRDWSSHAHQFALMADDIAALDGPLIVGGDFNTTYASEVYRRIDRYLTNTHWEAGWGFGFTFPAHAPHVRGIPIITSVIRIDHIFHNDHFFTHNAKTFSANGGSDHLPIVAELSLVK